MKVVSTLVVFIALVFAAPALADETALQLAQDAAAQYWGAPPNCPGGLTIAYATTSELYNAQHLPVPSGATIGALSYWTNVSPPYANCQITLNSDRFSPDKQASDFALFCGLVVHEYGHFDGYEDDPSYPATSINHMQVDNTNEHVQPCVQRYAAAEALLVPQLQATHREGRSTRRAGKRGHRARRSRRSVGRSRRSGASSRHQW
jgi:hypothetical protein